MAVVGGSSLPYPLYQGYYYRPGMNLSEKGKIYAFDDRADGMVPGFGCVVFVLKPYENALKDKDHIYARIKASSVNNDGRLKSTYTAPSTKCIAKNIQNLLSKTAVDCRQINFIEAHGSGTKIGDMLESAALKSVFRSEETGTHRVAVSSIKSTIGHLDAIAGHAGLLKSVFQVWQRKLYPAANFSQLNKSISFNQTPLYVPTSTSSHTALTGITNSLGIGGTNCTLLLNSPSAAKENRDKVHADQIVFVGANEPERLTHYITQLTVELKTTTHSFIDLAYTLSKRARGKKYVASYRVNCTEQLISLLENALKMGINISERNICLAGYSGHSVYLYSSEIDSTQQVLLTNRPASQQVSAAGDRIRDFLHEIWADNLMLAKIAHDTSFIEQGGHSILALSLIDDIKEKLGITLSLDWFSQHDKFSDQVSELKKMSRQHRRKTNIKRLRGGGEHPHARLILVHASISGAEIYQHISKLINNNIDVIAIDSHNLYAKESERIHSLDALAEFYTEQLIEFTEDKMIPHIIGG